MPACLNCGDAHDNPKFCGRSCSASYTNKANPRKKAIPRFCKCGTSLTGRKTVCDKCHRLRDMTIAEASYDYQHKSSVYGLIRSRARYSVKNELQECEVCKYDKHVEVAHVKGIAEFPNDTMLSVVNARSNLRLLCPNCHWEFDNLPRI